MPVVKMPDGAYVDMPDDMSARDLANFRLKTESPKARPSSVAGVAGEAGKGAARGFMGMARTIGQQLTPPEGMIAGNRIDMPRNPDLVNLNQQFDSMMGRDPNANPMEHAAGTIGEMGGGAMFPLGGGGLFGKGAGAMTDALGPRAGQYALPKLFEYTSGTQQAAPAELSALHEFLANQGGNVAGTLLGGGTLGRMAGRYGAKALVRALAKGGGEDATAAVPIPSYPSMPLSPEMMQRIMMGASAPLFTQGQQ